MDDRRIAEWLTPDAPSGEPLVGDADRVAAAPRRSVPVAPVAPVALAFEDPRARILGLIEAMGRRIRRRPLAALAIGAGIGFVIGGALSFRAGRLLLAAGARHAARELLKQVI